MRVRKAEPKKRKPRELAPQDKIKLALQESKLLRMKYEGATEAQIGKALDLDVSSVRRIWQGALAEWNGDHRKLVSKLQAEMLAAHEREIAETFVWGKKKPAAAALVRHRARMAISRICGHGNTMQVEHTGAQGGPIMTAQATPQDAAAMIRARFNGIEPYVGDADGSGDDTTH